MLKNLARRIELAELAAVGQAKLSEDCIHFPAKQPAVFDSDEQQEAAYAIKCPLHGDRFRKHFYLFRAPWRREREAIGRKNRSAKYKKAWLASGLELQADTARMIHELSNVAGWRDCDRGHKEVTNAS